MNRVLSAIETDLPLLHDLLTRRLGVTLAFCALFFVALQWGFYGIVLMQSENLVSPFGPIIGGDFIVFYEAAHAAWADPASLYGYETLNSRLATRFPAYEDEFRLGWQYPPTMYLPLALFASVPYPVAYGTWLVAGMIALYLCLRTVWSKPLALLSALASPAVFQAAITGQTGVFTAALFLLAVFSPDKRPIMAGIAAGILTIKPQLGLLIPIAYAASRCWTPFFVAGITGTLIAGLSVLLFGVEPWLAFVDAAALQGSKMNVDAFPFHKLTTPFGAAVTAGLVGPIAITLQIIVFFALAALVAIVWRSSNCAYVRASIVMIASLMVTPYVFYYELPIAVVALFLLCKAAHRDGFLPYEGLAVAALWLTPIFMPGEHPPAFPMVGSTVIAALALVVRRQFALGLGRAPGAHRSGDRSFI